MSCHCTQAIHEASQMVTIPYLRSIIKGSVILLPLLGITWIIGIFAVNANTLAFAWLFVILNSTQVSPGNHAVIRNDIPLLSPLCLLHPPLLTSPFPLCDHFTSSLPPVFTGNTHLLLPCCPQREGIISSMHLLPALCHFCHISRCGVCLNVTIRS